MIENPRYLSLQELAADLHANLSKLAKGQLSVDNLERLTEDGRELYERLVVLRHKAYDQIAKENSPDVQVEQATAPISFRIVSAEPTASVAPNQVSLIDAIEEITRQETAEQAPMNEMVEQKPAPVVIVPESLNDKLSKSIPAQESLARKLEHTPISDLKRAITLNQRFQFSRELFKGNNQDYEVSIEKLNSTSRDEAMKTLDSLRARYDWSTESPVAQDFRDLVERRHQG